MSSHPMAMVSPKDEPVIEIKLTDIPTEKNGIFVNGQFPGPAIEANWGDWVEVTLHNNITGPEEGTSMHWHGISQKGTQWAE